MNTAYPNIPYYFHRLTDGQKEVYNAIRSGLRAFAEEITLPPSPFDEISMIFNYIILDHPLIFYVPSFKYSTSPKHGYIRPDYRLGQDIVKKHTAAVMECLKVFDKIKAKSEADKELYLHDYCLDNFTYDYSFKEDSFSVLGPVLNNAAVCEGISKFAKLAFDYLGVKSLVVVGTAKNPTDGSAEEAHAWNIVKLGDCAYHLDVTFDMTLTGKTKRYDYYNLTDDDIKRDHTVIGKVPPCATPGNDWFSLNSLTVHSPAGLGKFIGDSLKRGNRNILVKLLNVKDTENITAKVLEIARKQYTSICNESVTLQINYNPGQLVFEINFV